MSKIWKIAKISKKKIFMNFRDIFMWVMVDENTSPGSVLDTISWSESTCSKKDPSFSISRKFTYFFSELLNLIRYFRTFSQQLSQFHLGVPHFGINFFIEFASSKVFVVLSSHVLLDPPKIFSSRVHPDHKFPQIITLHEDWNDSYNVSVRLKWRIWCFPKATIPLLSFFWNFFLKEFICILVQILELGGSRICQWKLSNLFVEIFENKDGNSFVGF